MALKIRPRAVAVCALLALGTGVAMADDTPYYFGISQTIAHDSNVFREGNATRVGDMVYTTALVGGIDQPIGRQRITGSGTVRTSRYGDQDVLNNNGYSLNLGLDWATIERLSGSVQLTTYQSLARFDPATIATTRAKNLEKSKSLSATARLGLVTRLSFDVGASHRNVDYSLSDPAVDRREYKQDVFSGGLRYQFSGALIGTAGLRHTTVKYPLYTPVAGGGYLADKVRRNDLDLGVVWVASGASNVTARISATRSKHSEAVVQDYSGVTGDLSWDWRPTGKLKFTTNLTRDTNGEDSVFATVDNSGTISSADSSISRVATSLRVRSDYAVLPKVGVYAELRYTHRALSQAVNTTVRSGSDNTTGWSLGASWTPVRNVNVACSVYGDSRTASGTTTLTSDFGVNTVGCTGRWTID